METKLIEMVRENPFLYDKREPLYKNVEAKEKKWKEISYALYRNEKQGKKRWITLRDRYHKDRKKRLEEIQSGSPSTLKTWKYMKSMRFLDNIPPMHTDYKANTPTDGEFESGPFYNIIKYNDDSDASETPMDQEAEEVAEEQNNILLEEIQEEPSAAQEHIYRVQHDTTKKKKRNLQHDNFDQTISEAHKEMTSVIQLAKQTFQLKQNSTNMFFSSIALQIEEANLPPHSIALIKSQIMQILSDEMHKYYSGSNE